MVSSLIFQKFSGEGLTEPPPQTPPPAFSWASPSVLASPSILGRLAPSTRASPSILGRFAPSIRASPSTFDWGPWVWPPKINSWIRPCMFDVFYKQTKIHTYTYDNLFMIIFKYHIPCASTDRLCDCFGLLFSLSHSPATPLYKSLIHYHPNSLPP